MLFSVEPVSGASYVARAFFPSTAKSTRNVLINTDQIFSSGWAAQNLLATSSATRSASVTSTPAPRPAPASRTTTGVR